MLDHTGDKAGALPAVSVTQVIAFTWVRQHRSGVAVGTEAHYPMTETGSEAWFGTVAFTRVVFRSC